MTAPQGSEAGTTGRLEVWLRDHQRLVLTVIACLAIATRAGYFLELTGGPLPELHRWVKSDMAFFHQWGTEIASGDWLTDQSLHPELGWHALIAARYLRDYPDERRALSDLPGAEGDRVAARALWERWYGGKQLHQEPLYPYLIGATYLVFGPEPRWVFAWQLVLGSLGCVLVYLITVRALGHVTGTLVGLLAVLCASPLFYEMVLIRTSLIVFTGLLATWVAGVALDRRTPLTWFLLGVTIGVATLAKATYALFAVALLALATIVLRSDVPRLLRLLGCLVGGVLLCLLPVVARNLTVGAPAFSLSSVGPLAFICSNTGDYEPRRGFFISEQHAHRVLKEGGGKGLPSVVSTLRTHDGVGSYLLQLAGKFRWIWHWYEKPNNTNFYYYRLHSAVLRWLPITAWVLAPLGLVGLVLAITHRRAVPIYILVASHLAPLLIFYVLGRFRAPLLVALAPFAAYTLVWSMEAVADRRFLRAGLVGVSVALLFWWVSAPLPPDRPPIRRVDYNVPFQVHYIPGARAAYQAADWMGLADLLEPAFRYEPPYVREVGSHPGGRAAEASERNAIRQFARLHHVFAQALQELGREGHEAESRRAAELLAAAQEGREPAGR